MLLKRSIYIKNDVRCRLLWINSQYYTWRKRRALCCYVTFSVRAWFVVWVRTSSPECSFQFEKYIKGNCCGCLEWGLLSHNITAEKQNCTLHQGIKWLSFCSQQRTRQTAILDYTGQVRATGLKSFLFNFIYPHPLLKQVVYSKSKQQIWWELFSLQCLAAVFFQATPGAVWPYQQHSLHSTFTALGKAMLPSASCQNHTAHPATFTSTAPKTQVDVGRTNTLCRWHQRFARCSCYLPWWSAPGGLQRFSRRGLRPFISCEVMLSGTDVWNHFLLDLFGLFFT